MASHKNIMTAVLLAPGPIATHLNVKNMSSAFQIGVTKAKFMSAANQLQASGLGYLIVLEKISSQAHVFVKKTPHEMSVLLQSDAIRTVSAFDIQEYEDRFNMPSPASVTAKMKQCLVELGLAQQEVAHPLPYMDSNSVAPPSDSVAPPSDSVAPPSDSDLIGSLLLPEQF